MEPPFQSQRRLRKRYESRREAATLNGYPISYSCEGEALGDLSGTEKGIKNVAVSFDYEFVIAHPLEQHIAEVIVQDLPYLELRILAEVSKATGVATCSLKEQDVNENSSEATVLVGLSSLLVDTVDDSIAACEYLEVRSDQICVPMMGTMMASYVGSDTEAVQGFVLHHIEKEMTAQNVVHDPIQKTYYVGNRSNPVGYASVVGGSIDETVSSSRIMAYAAVVCAVLLLLVSGLFIQRRGQQRKNRKSSVVIEEIEVGTPESIATRPTFPACGNWLSEDTESNGSNNQTDTPYGDMENMEDNDQEAKVQIEPSPICTAEDELCVTRDPLQTEPSPISTVEDEISTYEDEQCLTRDTSQPEPALPESSTSEDGKDQDATLNIVSGMSIVNEGANNNHQPKVTTNPTSHKVLPPLPPTPPTGKPPKVRSQSGKPKRKKKKKKKPRPLIRTSSKEKINEMETITESAEEGQGSDSDENESEYSWETDESNSQPGSRDPSPARSLTSAGSDGIPSLREEPLNRNRLPPPFV